MIPESVVHAKLLMGLNQFHPLQKEAVYTAVGLASYDLFDQVDFDSWFSSYLLSELKIQHPKYRIIRRRVVWLLGQWVGVKLSSNLRFDGLYSIVRLSLYLSLPISASSLPLFSPPSSPLLYFPVSTFLSTFPSTFPFPLPL